MVSGIRKWPSLVFANSANCRMHDGEGPEVFTRLYYDGASAGRDLAGAELEGNAVIGIGLYGENGHQVQELVRGNPRARVVAAAGFSPRGLAGLGGGVAGCNSLAELAARRDVELVSLCSPRRAEQARDAILCLQAGKHVYAEKPCALSEAELDEVVAAAGRAGKLFHEMAGTAFGQPYLAMREVVGSGRLGEIVQVLVQKSYPYFDKRPQDEGVDGGLLLQVGVHAVRMVEHVAGVRVRAVQAWETRLGNPAVGQLRMASAFQMGLENGGLATGIANYLNLPGVGVWGNEALTVFGTAGMVESHGGGQRTRLVIGEKDWGALDVTKEGRDYLEFVLDEISGEGEHAGDIGRRVAPDAGAPAGEGGD